MASLFKLIALFILTLNLNACGFHLRGHMTFPAQLNPLYLDSPQPFGPFEKSLRESLEYANVKIVNSLEKANATLNILNQSLTSTKQASSASTQVNQYNVTFSVTYELRSLEGQVVVPSRTVNVNKNYSVSANQMSSDQSPDAIILSSVYHDAAFLLIAQLNCI